MSDTFSHFLGASTAGRAKQVVIFDIDGTLANNDHRQGLIDQRPPDWDAFFAACPADMLHNEIAMLARALTYGSTATLIMCTGRPDNIYKQTRDWLRQNDVPYHHMLMRMAACRDPDDNVKEHMLASIRRQGLEVVLAIDDRPSVVEMWRRNDVPCLAVDAAKWAGRGA